MRVCMYGKKMYLNIYDIPQPYVPPTPYRLEIPAEKVILEIDKDGNIWIQIIEPQREVGE